MGYYIIKHYTPFFIAPYYIITALICQYDYRFFLSFSPVIRGSPARLFSIFPQWLQGAIVLAVKSISARVHLIFTFNSLIFYFCEQKHTLQQNAKKPSPSRQKPNLIFPFQIYFVLEKIINMPISVFRKEIQVKQAVLDKQLIMRKSRIAVRVSEEQIRACYKEAFALNINYWVDEIVMYDDLRSWIGSRNLFP